MSKYTQKEAVFNAVINVMGEQEGVYSPTKEQRAQVNNILFESFRSDTIAYDPEFASKVADDKELKAYVSGLQSNWLRKDKRLNGNVTYVAKNPGSRSGSTDPQVKAMRALLETKTDPAERTKIQSFLDKRLAEIRPAKAAQVIDVSALPAELQGMVSSKE